MSDGLDVVSAATHLGSGGGGALLLLLVQRLFTKSDKAEEDHAKEQEGKLDQVLAKVTKIETDIALGAQTAAEQKGILSKLEERINGIGNKHGERIDGLTDRLTRLEERTSRRAK